MAKRKTKKAKTTDAQKIPKFFTTDIEGSCVIFELAERIDHMSHIECMYSARKLVRYDGCDAITEDAVGAKSKTMFMELRDGTLLPNKYGEYDLCWYEAETEKGEEITLEDILILSTI